MSSPFPDRLCRQGGGRGGPDKDVTGHHRVPFELAIACWKYEEVSGDNFDVPQEPRRGLRGGRSK